MSATQTGAPDLHSAAPYANGLDAGPAVDASAQSPADAGADAH